MKFKEWYYTMNEVGTGTNCVAVFARPIFGGNLVSRNWPEMAGADYDSVFHKKHKKKKKKKEED